MSSSFYREKASCRFPGSTVDFSPRGIDCEYFFGCEIKPTNIVWEFLMKLQNHPCQLLMSLVCLDKYDIILHTLYVSAAPTKLEEQTCVSLHLYFPEVHTYILVMRFINFCFIWCLPALPAMQWHQPLLNKIKTPALRTVTSRNIVVANFFSDTVTKITTVSKV